MMLELVIVACLVNKTIEITLPPAGNRACNPKAIPKDGLQKSDHIECGLFSAGVPLLYLVIISSFSSMDVLEKCR